MSTGRHCSQLVLREDIANGRLTLVFSESPMELKQWAVVDAQGRETRVTLSQPEFGGRYDSMLFEFNDPRFREQLGIQ